MGFWQNLVDSYEKNADVLNKIYPLSTTSISNNSDVICIIVIDGEGKFIRADKIEKRSDKFKKNTGTTLVNITIPVTEESMGRSSGPSPHPVFDQYEYLKGNGEKYDLYIDQLKDFSKSDFATQNIKAIYRYIAKGTVATDLENLRLKEKTFLVFQVETSGSPQSKAWEDVMLFNAWHQYYLDIKNKRAEEKKLAEGKLSGKAKLSSDEKRHLKEMAKLKEVKSLDYITGCDLQPVACFHPKKISNASANSKLISDNDKTNYTFRGKFENSSQAVSIGYETSQKAHQFLRYLINDRGYYCGEQVIFSFTIGTTMKLLQPPLDDESIWALFQGDQNRTDSDLKINLRADSGFDYAEALRKSFEGFKYKDALKQHIKTAVIALDAATQGRLSITFYRELGRTEYLEKVANWHEGCKWNQQFWDKENKKYVPYTGAPSVDKIIEAVYGKPRGGSDESYTKIKKAARERLLRCIFDGAFLPKDYMVSAIRRASNPLSITKNNRFDRKGFVEIISTACALVRKDYNQYNKEEFKLSIELNRTDRDYLYGRLLGAADKLEEYALYKQENDRVVTAAIRHMQAFVQRPFRTWQTIHGCLNPYIQKVKGSFAFNEIQIVTQRFEIGEFEKDKPLSGLYLLGYYHERDYIDQLSKTAGEKKKSINNQKENENDGQ